MRRTRRIREPAPDHGGSDLRPARHQPAPEVHGLQRAGPAWVRDVLPVLGLSQAGFRGLAGEVSHPGPLPAVSRSGREREDSVPAVSGPGGGLGAAEPGPRY